MGDSEPGSVESLQCLGDGASKAHGRGTHLERGGARRRGLPSVLGSQLGPSTHLGVTVGHKRPRNVTVSQFTDGSEGVAGPGIQGGNHCSVELLGSLLAWCVSECMPVCVNVHVCACMNVNVHVCTCMNVCVHECACMCERV